MVGGLHAARSLPHLSEIVRLANAVRRARAPGARGRALARAARAERRRPLPTRRRAGAASVEPVDRAERRIRGCSINQATIKYAALDDALRRHARRRRRRASDCGASRSPRSGSPRRPRRVADSGLRVSSLCRGGFFTAGRGAGAPARRSTTTAARSRRPRRWPPPGAGIRRRARARRRRPARRLDRPRRRPRARARRDRRARAATPRAPGVHARHRAAAPDVRRRPRRASRPSARPSTSPSSSPPQSVGVVVDTFHVWWDPQVLDADRPRRRRRAASPATRCATGRPRSPPTCCSRAAYLGDGVHRLRPAHAARSPRPATPATSRSRSSTRRSGTPTGALSSTRTVRAFAEIRATVEACRTPSSSRPTRSRVRRRPPAIAVRHSGEGWSSVRPTDRVVLAPMADGGEGTLDAFELLCRVPSDAG